MTNFKSGQPVRVNGRTAVVRSAGPGWVQVRFTDTGFSQVVTEACTAVVVEAA